MKETIINSKYVKEVFRTPGTDGSEWFGYYNYDTLNYDQTKMLCNRSKVDGVAPEKGMTIELGFYDILTGEWHHIDESDSWNWQQGAMLQWLPGNGNENKVIFNRSDGEHLRSRIVDIQTGEKKDIDWPVYGITPDGNKSITLELERSYWCRAYHYQSIANPVQEGRVIDSDGIFEIDLNNNSRKRIVNIAEIISICNEPEFDAQKHWLEHIMISPDGTKFCFLHRYSPIDNVFYYTTRLFVCDIDGSNIQLMGNPNSIDRSHFGWAEDNSFVIYSYKKGFFSKTPGLSAILHTKPINLKHLFCRSYLAICARLPKPIYHRLANTGSLYQYFRQSASGKYQLDSNWNYKAFEIDGHPSFTKDCRYMITDTYPGKDGYQRLIAFDRITRKSVTLATHYANLWGNPASCDLHPKLSSNNDYVVVDSAFCDKHHMVVYKIDWQSLKRYFEEK